MKRNKPSHYEFAYRIYYSNTCLENATHLNEISEELSQLSIKKNARFSVIVFERCAHHFTSLFVQNVREFLLLVFANSTQYS